MNHMRASFVAGAVDWAKVICKQSRSRKVYLEIQEKQALFEIYQIPQSNPFIVAILNHQLHVVKHILEYESTTLTVGD